MEEQEMVEKKQPTPPKRTVRSEEDKRTLQNRLSRIEGQLRGMKRMIENDAYCPDILIQSCATQAALKSFSKVLLEHHMNCCVKAEIRAGNDEVIAELVHALHKLV